MNLPGFITRNFRLKLGCALLALVTWAGVVYASNPPETINLTVAVPQQRSSLPSGFILVNPIKRLPLRLGGTRESLNAFDPESDLEITVSWASVKHGGVQSIPVSVVNNDPNVELLDAPTAVQANIDRLGSESVAVTVVVTANPPPGFAVTGIATSPSTVTVAGPEHELSGLQARVSVDLSGAKANFKAQLNVYLYDARGNQIGLGGDLEFVNSVGSVSVTVSISSDVTSRIVAVLPQIVGRVATGYILSAIRYTPSSVTLSGPQDLLNGIDSVSTAPVSVNGLTGTETVSVPVQVGIGGVTSSATLITVTILVNQVTTPTPSPAASASP